MPRIANPMTLFAKPMSLIAKLGFPPVLCLVTIILFTCGKDSPTNSSRPGAAAPRVAVAPDNAATTPKSSATTPQTISAKPHSISIVPDTIQTIFKGRTTLLRPCKRSAGAIVCRAEPYGYDPATVQSRSREFLGLWRGLTRARPGVGQRLAHCRTASMSWSAFQDPQIQMNRRRAIRNHQMIAGDRIP